MELHIYEQNKIITVKKYLQRPSKQLQAFVWKGSPR